VSGSSPSSGGVSACEWYTVARKIIGKIQERQIYIKFCLRVGKSASGTLALLTLNYDEYPKKKSSGFEWQMWFTEGREDVQHDSRIGNPETHRTEARVSRVRTLVHR
jgi:hypothetical protein